MRSRRLPLSARAASLVVAVALGLPACSSPASHGGASEIWYVRASGAAPRISGTTLTDGAFAPSRYAGKVLVVNFWNFDCPPCKREQPLLESAWRRFQDHGVQFVGLMFVGGQPSWPNDPGQGRAYLRRYGVTYPALVDEDSSLARVFGVPGIPTTIVVDRTGRMRFRVLGQLHPGRIETLIRMAGG